jgi:hypothetical protein
MSINITEKSNFIWKIADILRGNFKQSEYGDVILEVVPELWTLENQTMDSRFPKNGHLTA